MNGPSTAREALIVEALGEVARLVDRIEALTSSMEAKRQALADASGELGDRLKAFEAGMASISLKVQASAAEQLVRRAVKASSESIEVQTRAMSEAARQAFAAQLDSTLARLTASVQQLIHRVERPCDLWLTHLATAIASSLLTWFVASSLPFR